MVLIQEVDVMMKRTYGSSMWFLVLAAGAALMLSSCGGGGGGTTGGTGVNGSMSGRVTKGPVGGATVTAYAINSNGTMGSMIGSAVTDSAGNFTMSTGAHSGPVMLQMSGGNYKDEATGNMMAMYTGDIMTTVIPTVVSGGTMTGIQMTPLTSMAQAMAQQMTGLMTMANITAANDAVGSYFMVNDILHTMPMDPTTAGTGTSATKDEKDYGMAIAAMSQEAKDLGMPHSSGMVSALMQDASDGVMNGMMGATTISMSGMGGMSGGGMGGGMMASSMSTTAGTSGLATAMASFMTNTAVNMSGITIGDPDMQALMAKLSNAPTQTIQ
jgi:hypothetical protein